MIEHQKTTLCQSPKVGSCAASHDSSVVAAIAGWSVSAPFSSLSGPHTETTDVAQQLSRWTPRELANFVASDHVLESSVRAATPSILRELARRVTQEREGSHFALRALYIAVLEAECGTLAAQEGRRFRPSADGPHARARLSLTEVIDIYSTFSRRIRFQLAEHLEQLASRFEQMPLMNLTTICSYTDLVSDFLGKPETLPHRYF